MFMKWRQELFEAYKGNCNFPLPKIQKALERKLEYVCRTYGIEVDNFPRPLCTCKFETNKPEFEFVFSVTPALCKLLDKKEAKTPPKPPAKEISMAQELTNSANAAGIRLNPAKITD